MRKGAGWHASCFSNLRRQVQKDFKESKVTAITTMTATLKDNVSQLDQAPESLSAEKAGNGIEHPHTKRPGRIVILITTLTFGGAETQVVRLATELKMRGWKVCVVCMVKPTAYTSQLEEQQIPVHSLDMKRGIADVRAIFRLASLIREFRPDIVHCHMYHANLLGRVTRLFCRMPALVCTAHNFRETSEQDGPTWHKELLYRITDPLAHKTTIICNAAFERYVRVGAVPRKKFQMIPNGVDTDHFMRSKNRRKDAREALGISSEFVWLAVGRLVKQKDYPTLFRALELLKHEQFVLLIAGNGPLEEELKEECRKRGLEGQVRFCGARENILDLYNAADAFVMSSEFEGLSAALLEAASTGLPAVVTDVGGNADVVIDEITGYVVPPAAPKQLATAIERLMTLPPERLQMMSDAARKLCHEQFRIAAVMDKWLDLYATFPRHREVVQIETAGQSCDSRERGPEQSTHSEPQSCLPTHSEVTR
jgi:glycosyltransferase involved in cell wall biosynthesis